MDALIEAIRQYERTYSLWGGYEKIGRDLFDFVSNEDAEDTDTLSLEASLDIMRGKRENLRDEQRRIVHRFLREKGLNIEINEFGSLEITQANKRALGHYQGKYVLLYTIDPVVGGEPIKLSCRQIEIEVSEGKLVGRSHTRDVANSGSRHEGPIDITTGVDNADVMLLVCRDRGRREPPVSFMLNFVDNAHVKMFYGIGLGLRFKNTRTVAAAKCIGLPASWFPDVDHKLTSDHVPQAAIDAMMRMLSSRNEFDAGHSVFFGFDFFDSEGDARQVLERAAHVHQLLSQNEETTSD